MEIKLEGPLFENGGVERLMKELEEQAIEHVGSEASRLLEQLECSVHHQRPTATLVREPDVYKSLKFTYCCDDMLALAKQTLTDAGLELSESN